MKLYSYQPPMDYKFETLKELALWFTVPKSFNDVFELKAPILMTPAVQPPTQSLDILKLALQCKRDNHVLHDDEWFDSFSKMNGLLDNEVDYDDLTYPDLGIMQSMIVNKVKENIGVVCFSDSQLNQLMWAYYAQSHTGFCVGYEVDTTKLSADKLYGKQVNYVSHKPTIDIWQLFFSDYTDQLVFTKSKDWAHESEYRIAANVKVQDKAGNLIGFANQSINGFKLKMPTSMIISELICGAKMTSSDKEKLKEIAFLISANQGKPVEVLHITEDPNRYKLALQKAIDINSKPL